MTGSLDFQVMGLRVDFDYQNFLKYMRGLKAAIRHRGRPIKPKNIPSGWELRPHHDPWPAGWSHYTDFWLSIWKKGSLTGEHVSIQPGPNGWEVKHNPRNSWTGGRTVHRNLSFKEAIESSTELILEVDG